MWWPETAKIWPSGAPPASDIHFRTYIVKATMIPNKNGYLKLSLDHFGTYMWPEMAQNWPSGASPLSDIDFRTTIVKATLIPNIKWTLVVQSTPFWTMYLAKIGRKMQKLGHLEHLQPQI